MHTLDSFASLCEKSRQEAQSYSREFVPSIALYEQLLQTNIVNGLLALPAADAEQFVRATWTRKPMESMAVRMYKEQRVPH